MAKELILICTEDNHSKFWMYTEKNNTYTARWGRIVAAGADKNRSVRGVTRHQRVQGFRRGAGTGYGWELAGVVGGINIHRDKKLLEIILASALQGPLAASPIWTPI